MVRLSKPIVVAAFIALVSVVLWTSIKSGQGNGPDVTSLQRRVNMISEMLRAPSDHNSMTVATSPIPQAVHMRYQIQQDVLAGMSNTEVIAAMVKEYGPSVRSAPGFSGFGRWVWILPAIGILIALVVCLTFALRLKQRSESVVDNHQVDDDQPSCLEHLRDFL